ILEAPDGKELLVAVKLKTISVLYLKEHNMSNKNKQLKKLQLHHDYLNRKVAEVTELRLHDRSIESKTILMRLKKEKLALKDQIAELEKNLNS
ncbi:MAG: hypothetical protein ACK55I_21615, partial [bacterium]